MVGKSRSIPNRPCAAWLLLTVSVAPPAPLPKLTCGLVSNAASKLKLKLREFSSPWATNSTGTFTVPPEAVLLTTRTSRPAAGATRFHTEYAARSKRAMKPDCESTAEATAVGPPAAAGGSRPATYRLAWVTSAEVSVPSPKLLFGAQSARWNSLPLGVAKPATKSRSTVTSADVSAPSPLGRDATSASSPVVVCKVSELSTNDPGAPMMLTDEMPTPVTDSSAGEPVAPSLFGLPEA